MVKFTKTQSNSIGEIKLRLKHANIAKCWNNTLVWHKNDWASVAWLYFLQKDRWSRGRSYP